MSVRTEVYGARTALGHLQQRQEFNLAFHDNYVEYRSFKGEEFRVHFLDDAGDSAVKHLLVTRKDSPKKDFFREVLKMDLRFEDGGNIISLENDRFQIIDWRDDRSYIFTYSPDPHEPEIAYLDSVEETSTEGYNMKRRILSNDEIKNSDFLEKGCPNRIQWVDTFLRLASGKQFEQGVRHYNAVTPDVVFAPDLTGDNISSQLVLPIAYRREDLEWYTQKWSLPIKAADLIEKTREGERMTRKEIFGLVNGYTRGEISDAQLSAWMMAVYFRGMTTEEISDLTIAMATSGGILKFREGIKNLDKHSSGGQGDKTTLVVGPLVAACAEFAGRKDIVMAKMTGRGLGPTGGTLDKLEAIPGFRTDLSVGKIVHQALDIGLALAAQTHDLAPADGKMYALRDVTGTIGSIPLITASIMSKKIAAGADVLVLDVKVGEGAFMKTMDDAVKLSTIMKNIGKTMGMKIEVQISGMDQPLGLTVGNALEVWEAIKILKGEELILKAGCAPITDSYDHFIETAARLVHMAGIAKTFSEAEEMVKDRIKDGSALAKFRQMVVAQHGDPSYVDNPYKLLDISPYYVYATHDGYINTVNALDFGEAAVMLGAGRANKGDSINPKVGFMVGVKVG